METAAHQQGEKSDHEQHPEQPELLTEHGEHEVRVRSVLQTAPLLLACPEPQPPPAAASQRIQRRERLGCEIRIRLRIQEDQEPCHPVLRPHHEHGHHAEGRQQRWHQDTKRRSHEEEQRKDQGTEDQTGAEVPSGKDQRQQRQGTGHVGKQ